ncbi:MAG: acyl carrier protein [Bacteroidia bacterium]|nr:acyl carrier protein [Bacteroidia bacterium]
MTHLIYKSMGSQVQAKDGNYSKLLKKYLQPSSGAIANTRLVREKLYEILADFTHPNTVQISQELRFKDDLGLDSLDMVEVIMICEKDFFTNLPDLEWTKSSTVMDLENLILKSIGR